MSPDKLFYTLFCSLEKIWWDIGSNCIKSVLLWLDLLLFVAQRNKFRTLQIYSTGKRVPSQTCCYKKEGKKKHGTASPHHSRCLSAGMELGRRASPHRGLYAAPCDLPPRAGMNDWVMCAILLILLSACCFSPTRCSMSLYPTYHDVLPFPSQQRVRDRKVETPPFMKLLLCLCSYMVAMNSNLGTCTMYVLTLSEIFLSY